MNYPPVVGSELPEKTPPRLVEILENYVNREDLIKKIEGLRKEEDLPDEMLPMTYAYNKALTDVINLIQEKPEKETPAVNR